MKNMLLLGLVSLMCLSLKAQSDEGDYKIVMRETDNGDLIADTLLIEADDANQDDKKVEYKEIWREDDEGNLIRDSIKVEDLKKMPKRD